MTIPQAIVALRKAIPETQQSLAVRLSLSVGAVARYEAGRIPAPGVLFRLTEVAVQSGQQEFADLFRRQMYEDMGVPGSEGTSEPHTPFEKFALRYVVTALRNPELRDKPLPSPKELEKRYLASLVAKDQQIQKQNAKKIGQVLKRVEESRTGKKWDAAKQRVIFDAGSKEKSPKGRREEQPAKSNRRALVLTK